ncbi:MAG: tyrosine-type recombinase/integrase [Nitrososphaeraceae archaeon]
MQSILAAKERITDHKTVNVFLSSMSRNSLKSKYTYQFGLTHFQRFLEQKYPQYNIDMILKPLSKNELDVYVILDEFVSYLVDPTLKLTLSSIKLCMAAIRSYLAYYDIDIIPSKFKRKVKMPKMYREDEEPLDASDIRKILLSCSNRRLKAYLLALASGGMRAVEALAIRLKDIDFTVSPTKIHIRKEYSKTKTSRDVYISDEATQYLRQWINWKYNNEERPRIKDDDDLVFTVYRTRVPTTVYVKVLTEFEKLLSVVGLDERKEGKQRRRKITLHSFRRFVKTVISDQTNTDYSEWFLGHNKSPYYTKKEPERREIYATKCMKYLTFLDYTTLEATGKNIEAKLSEKEREIQLLRHRDSMNSDAIASLSDQLTKVIQEIEILKKQN